MLVLLVVKEGKEEGKEEGEEGRRGRKVKLLSLQRRRMSQSYFHNQRPDPLTLL